MNDSNIEKCNELICEGHYDEALPLVAEECRNGNPTAYGYMGYMTYYGEAGIECDYKQALMWFEKGAEENDSLSLYYMGLMCEAYEGTEDKYDWYDAEPFMTRCAEQKGMYAQFAALWLGEFFGDSAKGGDPEVSIDYYTLAAELGNDDAIKYLAEYYYDEAENAEFKDENLNRQAYKYQEEAYEQNPHDESFYYGYLLEHGIGTPQNLRLAMKLYEEDYTFGHSQGPRALANHYEQVGDEKQTAYWHSKADENVMNDYEPEQEIEED